MPTLPISPRFPLSPILEAYGHYRISARTGAIAAGAVTKNIFYARNTHATKLMLLQELRIDGLYATTAFAAGGLTIDALVARAFTAENGAPGGTALTLTTNNAKMRTAMPTTALGVARIATTAALAAPTWTRDAQPVGQIVTHTSGGTSAATPIIGNIHLPDNILFQAKPGDEYPLVLAQDEGISIDVTVPATGVWTAGVTMRWVEVAAYEGRNL